MRQDGFQVTVNARGTANQTIWNNIYYFLYEKAYPCAYLVRLTLENNNTYQEAYDTLTKT